jgi:hypothetical protein
VEGVVRDSTSACLTGTPSVGVILRVCVACLRESMCVFEIIIETGCVSVAWSRVNERERESNNAFVCVVCLREKVQVCERER